MVGYGVYAGGGAVESPIEYILGNAINAYVPFQQAGLRLCSQVPIVCGNHTYRADFVLCDFCGRPMCIVEADGAAYHQNKARDAARSRQIARYWGVRTARFSGRAINKDVWACCDALYAFVAWGHPIPAKLKSTNYSRPYGKCMGAYISGSYAY